MAFIHGSKSVPSFPSFPMAPPHRIDPATLAKIVLYSTLTLMYQITPFPIYHFVFSLYFTPVPTLSIIPKRRSFFFQLESRVRSRSTTARDTPRFDFLRSSFFATQKPRGFIPSHPIHPSHSLSLSIVVSQFMCTLSLHSSPHPPPSLNFFLGFGPGIYTYTILD